MRMAVGEMAEERRNFYGRVHGKTLRPSQKAYLAEDLGRLSLAGVTRGDNPGRAPVDLGAVFGARPLWLEVGFGGGEHLVHMAARYPQRGDRRLRAFRERGGDASWQDPRGGGFENLALHPGDVRDLFDVVPEGSIREGLPELPRPLAEGPPPPAPLRDAGLSGGAAPRSGTGGRVPRGDRHPRLCPPDAGGGAEGRASGWWGEGGVPWADWLSTRYEQKALREGRLPHYLTFERL